MDKSYLYIQSMIESCERILFYIKDMKKEQFENDTKTLDAVIRNFETLGEATTRVSDEIKKNYPQINWLKIKDMRNFLIHQYLEIDTAILWQTTQEIIPDLHANLKNIPNG